ALARLARATERARVPGDDDEEAAVHDAALSRELIKEPRIRVTQGCAAPVRGRWQGCEARRVDLARADDDLKRVRQRAQQRGPTVDDRALLGLALDAEGQRRALQQGAKAAAAQMKR